MTTANDRFDAKPGRFDAGWRRRFVSRFTGKDLVPAGFEGTLTDSEHVLAAAELVDGTFLVATSLGLWLPEGGTQRRVVWHLISKAVWAQKPDRELVITEAEETGTVQGAVLLTDRPPHRFTLATRGSLPEVVNARVTATVKSAHHRDLPGGGAWFVQRKVSGADGIVLQVRADPGTEENAVRSVAGQVAGKLRELHDVHDEA
ncbi:MAG TPA: hypothetical protein VHX38_17240 [Pseudonocardiaceae bacterium]|jgi:hypothetical protein|nr:hypothetical protein [Pseudonocardiaceae bacterium]